MSHRPSNIVVTKYEHLFLKMCEIGWDWHFDPLNEVVTCTSLQVTITEYNGDFFRCVEDVFRRVDFRKNPKKSGENTMFKTKTRYFKGILGFNNNMNHFSDI